jgi:hypothetical protein
MAAIHFHSFSRAYNKWLDYSADFSKDFEDSQEFTAVLKVIIGLLNRNLNHPIEDPGHPFRRYADISKTLEENYGVLAADVMAQIQEVRLRGYVYAFFHSGGVNYSDMKDLMDEYFVFADRSEDAEYSDGSTVDESEEGHVYEDEESDGEDTVGQANGEPVQQDDADEDEEFEGDEDDEDDEDDAGEGEVVADAPSPADVLLSQYATLDDADDEQAP